MLEIIYILAGFVSLLTGIIALMDAKHTARYGTASFWILFGLIFIVGKYFPPQYVGGTLIFMAFLTATKKVKLGVFTERSTEERENRSLKFDKKLFIPALTIGGFSYLFSLIPQIGPLVGLGIGSLISCAIAWALVKEPAPVLASNISKMLQQMGAAVILPQLLASLGAIFTQAGVGQVITDIMVHIVPLGNRFTAVALYCISMAVFTIIMGNGFAAFAVITAGIGIPFVVNQGGNPAIVGVLGLTSGYCGTLMTPMAANFNIVPATIMEMDNKYGVILTQLPVALSLLALHIVLMYSLAFIK